MARKTKFNSVPKRIQKRNRPSVPFAIRVAAAAANAERYQEMLGRARKVWDDMNDQIDIIADETETPRSIVARIAFGHKPEVRRRKKTPRQAYISCKMAELNKGKSTRLT